MFISQLLLHTQFDLVKIKTFEVFLILAWKTKCGSQQATLGRLGWDIMGDPESYRRGGE